jgi:hypothetical protein
MVTTTTRDNVNKLSRSLNKKYGGVYHQDYIIQKAIEQLAKEEGINL